MDDETIVAFDGAWSHRRHAKECIVILIDCNHKRIIDFEIVTKDKCGIEGNWKGSCNGMELHGVKQLIERWKDNGKVKGVVHDNDSKATLAIAESGWKVEQWYDPNHVVKQFETRWNSCETKLLRGFHAKLLLWFKYLIRSDFSKKDRKKYWMNAVEHFKGNHTGCPREHPGGDHFPAIKDPRVEKQLLDVLKETKELLGRARSGFDTQLCESCNSLKTKYANKDTSWKCSWGSRVMCALMQVNSQENWRITLAQLCNVPLSLEVVAELNHKWELDKQLQAKRGTEEARLIATRRRWERRHAESLQKKGIRDYGHTPARQPRTKGRARPPAIPEEIAIPQETVIPEETVIPDETDLLEETIVPDETDRMVLYAEALEQNRFVEVPKERDDDEVQIVRNEIRFTRWLPNGMPWAMPFIYDWSAPGMRDGDGVSVDEVEDTLDDERGERDEEDDDSEHLDVLQALPPGLIISDDTFDVEGGKGIRLSSRAAIRRQLRCRTKRMLLQSCRPGKKWILQLRSPGKKCILSLRSPGKKLAKQQWNPGVLSCERERFSLKSSVGFYGSF
jgi:hypothetical protein